MVALVGEFWENPVRRRLAWALGAAFGVYVTLLAYRLDYLGHFLAGAALGLLAIIALADRVGRIAVLVLPVSAGVLLAGALSERWWFGDVFFDWLDVIHTGFGALVVGAALLPAVPTDLRDRALTTLAAAMLVGGFLFRFLVPELVQ